MKGGVYPGYKGAWNLHWSTYENGVRKQHKKTIRTKTKREAEKILREIVSSLDNGSYIDPLKITLGEYLETWIEKYKAPYVEPNTTKSIRQHLHHIYKNDIQHRPLQELTTDHIQTLVNQLVKRGLKPRTIQRFRDNLRNGLNAAVELEYINRNPVKAVKIPTVSNDKDQRQIWTDSEIAIYMDYARANRSPLTDAIEIILHTGLRRSEVAGLKWKAVHLDEPNPFLEVINTRHSAQGGGYYEKGPKSASGRRWIYLHRDAVDLLRTIQGSQQLYMIDQPEDWPTEPERFVISKPDGTPYAPSYIREKFQETIKALGLPHTTVHNLRHVHATKLAESGYPIERAGYRLGHANSTLTSQIYNHYRHGAGEEPLEGLNGWLKPSGS